MLTPSPTASLFPLFPKRDEVFAAGKVIKRLSGASTERSND
jgi:hypothetical protein